MSALTKTAAGGNDVLSSAASSADENSVLTRDRVLGWTSGLLVFVNTLYKRKRISLEERTRLKLQIFDFNPKLLMSFSEYLNTNEPLQLLRTFSDVLTEDAAERAAAAEEDDEEQGDEEEQEQQQQEEEGEVNGTPDDQSRQRYSDDYPPPPPTVPYPTAAPSATTIISLPSKSQSQASSASSSSSDTSSSSSSSSSSLPIWPKGADCSLPLTPEERSHIKDLIKILGLYKLSPQTLLGVFIKGKEMASITRESLRTIAFLLAKEVNKRPKSGDKARNGEEDDEDNEEDEEDEGEEEEENNLSFKVSFVLFLNILTYMFQIIDIDQTGFVNVPFFVTAFATLVAGTAYTKLSFTFDILEVAEEAERIYDEAGNPRSEVAAMDSEGKGVTLHHVVRYVYATSALLRALLALPDVSGDQFVEHLVEHQEASLSREELRQGIEQTGRISRFLFGNANNTCASDISERIGKKTFVEWQQSAPALVYQHLLIPALLEDVEEERQRRLEERELVDQQ